jgi:uncharacterized membrane protein
MVVLAVLIVSLLVARLLGALGIDALASWPAASRVGLAAMFLFTALAHFNSMRHDLARMLPPIVPRPLGVVYFTGVCEILGAIGLLLPSTRTYAAAALILFLIAVLPANIHAARAGVTLRNQPATPLILRIPIQLFFIALSGWAGIVHAR